MKINRQHFLIISTIAFLAVSVPNYCYGQGGNSGKIDTLKLKSTWKMDYQASWESMSQDLKNQLNGLSSTSLSRIENTYKQRKLTFGDNGSFTLQINETRIINGTWKLTSNKKHIIVTNPDGDTQQFDVITLTNNQMVISPKSKNIGKMYFPKWHLIKE
jgi:hypothetical protein